MIHSKLTSRKCYGRSARTLGYLPKLNSSDLMPNGKADRDDSISSPENRFSGASVCRRLAFICCICILIPTIARSQLQKVVTQSWVEIAKANGTDTSCSIWCNPRALYFDAEDGSGNIIKKVMVNWQTNEDYYKYPYLHGRMTSSNGGVSYGSITTDAYCDPFVTGTLSDTFNVDLMSAIKRRDGTIIAIPFRVKYPPVGQQATLQYKFSYNTSTDNGATWTHYIDSINGGTVNFPSLVLGMRFHRGVIEENDGSLYAPAYVRFATDTVFRVALMKSTDGGVTWDYQNTIQFTPTLAYTETALVRCANGDWLAVMRNDAHGAAGTQRLKQKRSTDHGATWGSVIYTPGITAYGVDPCLTLMPNGILVLSFGDNTGTSAGRNVRLAFSTDNGNNWTNGITTFTGVAGGLESTGYTSVVPVTGHRLLQITDQGISWSYSSPFPGTNPYAIKQKIVDLVRTQRNRIDLKTKYSTGAITVQTNMDYSSATHPEARTSGAFDGSADYWSGAFKAAGSGYFVIDLKDSVYLNAIGLCLQINTAQSATVDVSTDSTNWTTIKTYTNAVQQCLEYTNLTPVNARYIRVSVNGSGSMVSLNEIELYSTADTYENDAQNQVPDGYTTLSSGGFWVSEGVTPLPTGYESKRGLYMSDGDGTNKEITKTISSAETTKTLAFRLRTKAFAASNGAIQWRLTSGTTNAFRMKVVSGGAVQYYSGGTYHTVSGISISNDTWTYVKMTGNASTGTGTISINGGPAHSIGKESTVSSLNGFRFSSGGAASVGDQAIFDDVIIYGSSPGSGTTSFVSDGEVMESSVKKAVQDQKLTVVASPNPAQESVNLVINNQGQGTQARIEFTNAMGQPVKQIVYHQPRGESVQRISLHGMAAGIYIITVTQGTQTARTRLLVK